MAFEFRANAARKEIWNRAFFWGSLVAVVAQGLTLGGVISGTKVFEGQFAGGPLDWLNPFTVTLSLALLSGYILLGSTYLIIKTTGTVQQRAYRQAFRSGWAVLGFQVVVTIWTPFHYPSVWVNWFSPPRIYFIWTFPILGLLAFYALLKTLKRRREVWPFLCSVGFFLAGYLGLASSLYPYAIPPNVTFQEAAAQRETMLITLWGAMIVLPMVLAYVIYSYSIFRGKVGNEGYHA